MISSKLPIQLQSVDSITDEVLQLQNYIAKRAYEIFLSNSSSLIDHAVDDWLAAENELVCRPSLELREKHNAFDVRLALAGYEPKEIDVRVTPNQLLVSAETGHEHKEDAGRVHTCEFKARRLSRTIDFPKRVNPEAVRAEYRDGVLQIHAEMGKEQQARKVDVQVA
jgi:HSP20 family protein